MLRHLAVTAVVCAMLASSAMGDDRKNEAAYRNLVCAGFGMEVPLERQSRADCVSPIHAIEVEWGVGQALAYAAETTLIPGIILICRKSAKHYLASSRPVHESLSAYGISATVWSASWATAN